MRDTIQDGQFVLVDRLTPHFDPYHRGDIVVFRPPENNETGTDDPFIKRVIGVAGDTVAIHDGKVFVNGIELNEPYVFEVGGVAQPTVANGDVASWTIAPGELFVMGDHRAASSDSRVFGPIKVDAVIGRAWLRYWPLEDLGILPTQPHPELVGSSPGASHAPSASPSSRPSAKPTKRPTATPKH
jgi:signal peptidase I